MKKNKYSSKMIVGNKEISFNQYKNRLEDVFLTTRREQYFDEIFRPFLKMCCPDDVNIIPVFDDRNVGRQTDAEGQNKKRIETISASYFDENGKKKYVVPDYVFVNSKYTFDNPLNPYIMVETKIPQLIYENNSWFYCDLIHQIKGKTKLELTEEIKKCGCVIFTDGITWSVLELKQEKDKGDLPFEISEPVRLVEISTEKYCERKDCNFLKISWKNGVEILDETFFKEVGLDISGDIEPPPDDWYNLIEQIRNLVKRLKEDKEKQSL